MKRCEQKQARENSAAKNFWSGAEGALKQMTPLQLRTELDVFGGTIWHLLCASAASWRYKLFTRGTCWKVPYLLPGRGTGTYPTSCIISSKKNNPKVSSKTAEQLRLAFFFPCKYKMKKNKAASIWKKKNHPFLYKKRQQLLHLSLPILSSRPGLMPCTN